MSDEQQAQAIQQKRDDDVTDAQEAAKEKWGDDAQPSTDPTIHYDDVGPGVVGTPTEGPAAIEAGTESDEARERREAAEAEAEKDKDEE